MMRLLIEHKVEIAPQDAEVVIDCWEKLAINGGR